MPNVLQVDGYSFHIYPRDHPPPHVHVCTAGAWCVVELGDEQTPPSLYAQGKMRAVDAKHAVWIATGVRELLQAHWRRMNGTPDR